MPHGHSLCLLSWQALSACAACQHLAHLCSAACLRHHLPRLAVPLSALRPHGPAALLQSLCPATTGLLKLEHPGTDWLLSHFLCSDINAAAQAPLYTVKARLLPRATFVVGYDTAIRLVMPKYYGGQEGMLLQFAELKHAGGARPCMLARHLWVHRLYLNQGRHVGRVCSKRLAPLQMCLCSGLAAHEGLSSGPRLKHAQAACSIHCLAGCSFLVAGRSEGSTFKSLKDVDMPEALAGMVSTAELPAKSPSSPVTCPLAMPDWVGSIP